MKQYSKFNEKQTIGQRLPNSIIRMPRELLLEAYKMERESIALYGSDPCTREQAAAHEAGHLVVAHCIGEKILGAQVYEEKIEGRMVWLGVNNREHPDYDDVKDLNEKPRLMLRRAFVNLAGWMGEEVAGISHMSSSIDERVMATFYCVAIDEALRLPKLMTAHAVSAVCAYIIRSNHQQFDLTRGTLERCQQLTEKDADRIFREMKPYDLDQLFEMLNGVRHG